MKLQKITLILCCTFGFALTSTAQDVKAKAILDELSEKTRKYTSITSDFTFTLTDKLADINQTQDGLLKMQGKKYYIKLGDNQIFSDGQTRWTYNEGVNEVYIDHADGGEDVLNPADIYTVWETGFKHYFEGESTANGITYLKVKLNPTKPQDKTFHTVNLSINKSKMEIEKMEILGKQGDDYVYKVKTFQTNKEYPNATFIFNKANFPGVEAIDNR